METHHLKPVVDTLHAMVKGAVQTKFSHSPPPEIEASSALIPTVTTPPNSARGLPKRSPILVLLPPEHA